jgi:hypothetical protein
VAKTCNVFKSHFATKQVDEIVTWGQKSGDAELAGEAASLQMDLRKLPQRSVPALMELVKMIERCNQLGALPKSDVTKDLAPIPPGIRT